MVERIVDLIKKKGMSINAVEKQLGFGNGAIKRFDTNSPSIDKIISLSNFLNVSLDYLVIGNDNVDTLSVEERKLIDIFKKLSPMNRCRVAERAETLAELQTPEVQDVEEEPEDRYLKINCSTYRVSAGIGFELGEGDEWYEIEVPDTAEARNADFALQIKGNSMEPIYFDGDIVLVKEQPSVDFGQIGIFSIEGYGYIKKYGGNKLISLNAEYDDIEFSDYDEDSIRCHGKVIGRV